MGKKKSVLFLCIGNCCRSQMAEGFALQLAGDKFEIYSAGSDPAGYVHPEAMAAMKEIGIDMSAQWSKRVADIPVKTFDYAVTMGCGVTCPIVPTKELIEWVIPDPIGRGQDFFNKIRDDLGKRVKDLMERINRE
ncbi:MAG: arsenate reductase ArsC [bacterium]